MKRFIAATTEQYQNFKSACKRRQKMCVVTPSTLLGYLTFTSHSLTYNSGLFTQFAGHDAWLKCLPFFSQFCLWFIVAVTFHLFHSYFCSQSMGNLASLCLSCQYTELWSSTLFLWCISVSQYAVSRAFISYRSEKGPSRTDPQQAPDVALLASNSSGKLENFLVLQRL